jgi:hypothetical protein
MSNFLSGAGTGMKENGDSKHERDGSRVNAGDFCCVVSDETNNISCKSNI